MDSDDGSFPEACLVETRYPVDLQQSDRDTWPDSSAKGTPARVYVVRPGDTLWGERPDGAGRVQRGTRQPAGRARVC